jgi:hypothetical protein
MKLKFLGFELESRFELKFGPTIETRIRYCRGLKRFGYWRCRFLHRTTWILDDKFQGYRWYCCKDCKDTWLEPQRGTGVVD